MPKKRNALYKMPKIKSRLGREFIGLIYFTWFDFLSKVRAIFSFRVAQGLGTDLVEKLICYSAQKQLKSAIK